MLRCKQILLRNTFLRLLARSIVLRLRRQLLGRPGPSGRSRGSPKQIRPPSSSHALSPQINAACSGASASERTAASAIRALASVPCAWLQPHALDLCDALRAAASMCPPQLLHPHTALASSRQCSCLLCLVTILASRSLQSRQRLRLLPLHHIAAMRCVRVHW